MTTKKTIFSMTRHERVGAAIVLAVLAVAVWLRACVAGGGADGAQDTAVASQLWQQRCDSVAAVEKSHPSQKVDSTRKHAAKKDNGKKPKGGKEGKKKAGKPAKQPATERRIDPVPTF